MFGIITAAASTVASFIGSVGSACVSIGSSIASAVTSIAPTLAKFATPIIEGAKNLIAQFPKLDLEQIKVIIETALNIIHVIVDVLGLNKHKMSQEEIGERALQNPEIKPEDYDREKDHLDALHAAKYEPGKRPDGVSPDAWKAMCRTVGAGLEVKAISEDMMMATPCKVFIDCAKAGLSAKDIVDGKGGGIMEKMRANGVKDATELSHYLDSKSCGVQMESAMKGFVAPETGLTSAQMAANYAADK